jgi:hypothetical protein
MPDGKFTAIYSREISAKAAVLRGKCILNTNHLIDNVLSSNNEFLIEERVILGE